MRKSILPLCIGGLLSLALTSCFKDEPLNAEADIEEAYLHTDNDSSDFYSANDTLVNVLSTDNKVEFFVRPFTNRTALAPMFRLTPGATITPASGSVHNFKDSTIIYTVCSEDHQWQRQYEVSVSEKHGGSNEEWLFDFENFDLDPNQKFYVWTDTTYTDVLTGSRWATGNGGYMWSAMSATPEEYPSVPTEGMNGGHAVKLTTRDTFDFGKLKNMRLAAGNLFIGHFDSQTALLRPLKATQFGLPVVQKPIYFSGYYKYQPGEVYQDAKGKAVEGKTDEANIYAVFYRNTDDNGNTITLNGEDVLTNENIVATAIIDKVLTTDEWTSFHIPFTYLKDVDATVLRNYGYNLALVFSSSNEGDKFEGAIGSTLIIDKVTVSWETSQNE